MLLITKRVVGQGCLFVTQVIFGLDSVHEFDLALIVFGCEWFYAFYLSYSKRNVVMNIVSNTFITQVPAVIFDTLHE